MTLTERQRAAARAMAEAWEKGREAVYLASKAKEDHTTTFLDMVREANRLIKEGDERGPYYGYMPGKVSSTNTLIQTVRRAEKRRTIERHNKIYGHEKGNII